MVLAIHNFESAYQRLPPLMGGGAKDDKGGDFFIAGGSVQFSNIRGPMYVILIPYITNDPMYSAMHFKSETEHYTSPYLLYRNGPPYDDSFYWYIDPNDPSSADGRNPQGKSICSFAANAQLFADTDKRGLISGELTGTSRQFDRGLPLDKIPDGASNTIAFAEKYGTCGHGGSLWSAGITDQPIRSIPANTPDDPYYWPVFGLARDAGIPARVYGADPATLGSTAESRLMFQIRPDFQTSKGIGDPADAPGCDAFRASTPFRTGIPVAVADGSVRTIPPSVDPQIWFSMLYPDDGCGIRWD